MSRRQRQPEPTLIERQAELDELCAECAAQGRFAFDTEFVMEDRYESEVCLIQVATTSRIAIVDPLSDIDLTPMWGLVSDPGVETVVHAGQEDLALCVQHTGLAPRNVFDVQVAAGLVGYDYPLSLQKLLQTVLQVRLHKSKTLTDWRRRPLAPEQIQYGAEDVGYLLAVREAFGRRLAQLGRLEWAQEEFRSFEDMSLYQRSVGDKLARVKGSGSLRGRQLAILRELLPWRDQLAQVRNRPARTVVKDHLLVEIAKLALSTHAEIRSLRGINLSDRDVHALAHVVEKGLAIPEDQWPKRPPRAVETPGEAAMAALITAVLHSYCDRHSLAHSLVATKRSIHELVQHNRIMNAEGGRRKTKSGIQHSQLPIPHSDKVQLLRGWRSEAVGGMLSEVLAGHHCVRVGCFKGEPCVDLLPVPPVAGANAGLPLVGDDTADG